MTCWWARRGSPTLGEGPLTAHTDLSAMTLPWDVPGTVTTRCG